MVKDAEKRLNQISKLDRLIERTLEQLNMWRNRIESSGYMSSGERVQSSADLHRSESMIAFYIDYESECRRKIELYSYERAEIIKMIEALENTEYDVIYMSYVDGLLRYEIADKLGKSESLVAKAKKSGLEQIQQMMEGN